MIEHIRDWLDIRTGYRDLLVPVRRRVLPTGPRWSYSLASCLLWLLVVQVITGFFLMTTYSPSTTSAWASVHYIEQSPFGSFLRGMHYFAAQAMIILFAIHVIRVLLSAAFRAPRELIWITGLLLIPLMMVWAITGNPLAANQKGISQIEVEGNILGSTPLIGPLVKRVLIGGEEIGHLTLTHLYFLHVGLLPLIVTVVLVVHMTQIYRHGLTPQRSKSEALPPRPYWPYQSVRNMTSLALLLGVLAMLAIRFGAPLDAPADPLLTNSPRPEWYFRSLFELRRYFTGNWEFVATVVIPMAVLLLLFAVPVMDKWFRPRVSFSFRLLIVLAGLGGWGTLTYLSFARDWRDAEYLASVERSEQWAERSRALADKVPIPAEGAIVLLRDDPKTQGPLLFERHCASCHSYISPQAERIVAHDPSAPNLFRFASTDWIVGLLDPQQIATAHYFGKTKMAEGDMATAIAEKFEAAEGEDQQIALKNQLLQVARALSAEANLPNQAEADARDVTAIEAGRQLLVGDLACTDCHRFRDQGELGSAPDLTGYGSQEWLSGMISNPEQERFYGGDRNDRMPAFAPDAKTPHANLLSSRELDLLVRWLRGEWYEPAAIDADQPRTSTEVAKR